MKTKRVFSLCVIVLCFVFMATISSASNLYADGKIIKKGQPNSRGFSFCETAEEEEKDFPSWEECYIVTYKIPN